MRWFKHLSNASEDEKLAELIEIHGAEGYGIYWMILEKIADKMVKGETSTNCKYPASKWAKICGKNPRGMNKFYETFAYLKLMKISYIDNSSKHIDIDCHNLLKYRDEYSKKSRQKPDIILTDFGQTPDQDIENIETEVKTDTERNIQKEIDLIINLSNELFTRDGYDINNDNFNARDMIGLRIIENGVEKVETAIRQAREDYYDNKKMHKNCHWEILFRPENIRKLFTQSTLSPPDELKKSGSVIQMPAEIQ